MSKPGLQLCEADNIGVQARVDFILAFWMVHEVPDQQSFFNQLKATLLPDGKILVAEPKFHVTADAFDRTIELAESCGLKCVGRPKIRFSRTALFDGV